MNPEPLAALVVATLLLSLAYLAWALRASARSPLPWYVRAWRMRGLPLLVVLGWLGCGALPGCSLTADVSPPVPSLPCPAP